MSTPPDPVNDFDLSGEFGLKSFANIASFASIIPGPIGMASAAVSAAAYAAAGDKKNAALMAAGVALAAVGAGAAVKAVQAARLAGVGAKTGQFLVKAAPKVKTAVSAVRDTKVSVALHGPHHSWPKASGINGKVWMRHVQILVKTPNNVFRKQLPFGPQYLYKNGVKGPKGRIKW